MQQLKDHISTLSILNTFKIMEIMQLFDTYIEFWILKKRNSLIVVAVDC